MLIINAKIFTMNDAVIEDGYVQCQGTLITAVGPMPDVPADQDTVVVDAGGGWLFPGFIDAHCHVGMWEDSMGFEGDDGNEDTDPSTPNLRAIDAVNPFDRCFKEALEAGITTVITGPGSANVIGGQMAALKTAGKRIDDMILKAPLAIKFALGENPKTVYHGKNLSPVTRMATAAIIREQLTKARHYWEQLKASAADPEMEEPEYDAKCEALIPLLKKEIPAHIHAHRIDDLFTAVRLAKEFNIDYVLIHATSAHLAADLFAGEQSKILLGPLLCDRSKPEMRDLTPAAPASFAKAGLKTAIVSDHPVIPIQYLPLCAGLAVREGLDWTVAMESITITAAKICSIDDQVGSIEVGKTANLVLFEGDPLMMSSKPRCVVLDGSIAR